MALASQLLYKMKGEHPRHNRIDLHQNLWNSFWEIKIYNLKTLKPFFSKTPFGGMGGCSSKRLYYHTYSLDWDSKWNRSKNKINKQKCWIKMLQDWDVLQP